MENSQNNIPNGQNLSGQTPQAGDNRDNEAGNKKKIFMAIGIAAAIIALAAGYFLTKSTSFQGSMLRGGAPGRAGEPRAVKVNPPRDKTTGSAAAPTEVPPPEETPPPAEMTIFDQATMAISYEPFLKFYQPHITTKNSVLFYKNENGWLGTLNMNFPFFKPDAETKETEYLQEFTLEICVADLTKCLEIEKDKKWIFKNPGKQEGYKLQVHKIGRDEFYNLIQNLGVGHGGKITFRYKLVDPGLEKMLESPTTPIFDVFDDAGVPVLPSGKTLFDPNTFIATVEQKPGNFEENATTIFFDNEIKSAIGIPLQLPSYSIEDTLNAKDSYLQALKFSMCDETYTLCTSLKEDTTWVYANEKKFQSENVNQYKFKEYIISNNDLLVQIKNFLKTNGADKKIFLRYSIMDPANVEIHSNATELQISEEDRNILLGDPIAEQPIVGTYFDESAFKIKKIEGYAVTENTIHYKKDMKQAIKFLYQLPGHKPGNTEDEYYKTVYLDYCDETFENCVVADEFETIIFKKYPTPEYQNKQMIIQDVKFDELVDKNPDKSFFRYRVEDPTGVNIYTNNYQLVVE